TLFIAQAFRAHGLDLPQANVSTFSAHLRFELVATGRYVTVTSGSNLRFSRERTDLKILPIDMPAEPQPIGVVMLKQRTLRPIAPPFIECLRAVIAES